MEKAVSGLAMAPRGFNISAPWRHRPDRDVSRRIPGQTLRHCHDACIAPDHGAQGFARAGAVSGIAHPGAGRGIRQWAGGRVRGMGVAGRLGPSRLVRDVLPESPRWKTGLAVLRRGAECAALLLRAGTTRCPIVERRGAMACARLGKGRAGKRRDVPLKAAGGPKGTGLGPFFSGPEDSGPSCLFFFPACRGRYAACGSGPTLVCP